MAHRHNGHQAARRQQGLPARHHRQLLSPYSVLADKFDPASTIAVLLEAGRGVACSDEPPTVVADAGVENLNGNVDELIQSGVLRRVIALTELRFSNSMIEAWWRTLKHQWLYLNSLDSLSTLRRLVSVLC